MEEDRRPTSTSRRIWILPESLVDAVLAFSFDDGEIENLCSGAGIELHCAASHRPLAMHELLYRACREDTPLARRVERTLNLMHAEALEDRDAQGASAYAKHWLARRSPPSASWAAALWAIGTSAQPGMDCVARRLGRFLALDALRALRPAPEPR